MDKLKAAWLKLSNIWGKTTTVLLGLFVSAQGFLMDPDTAAFIASVPWGPKAIAYTGLAIAFLRLVSPKGGNVQR